MSTLTTKVLKEAMAVQDGLLGTIDKLCKENEKLKEKINFQEQEIWDLEMKSK